MALFDKVPANNMFDYNYLSYRHKVGLPAYEAAVSNGYFDYIIAFDPGEETDDFQDVRSVVNKNLKYQYAPVYIKDEIIIYRKIFAKARILS